MVLEQLFKEKWLEKRPLFAFLIGVIYSLIGILFAYLIFPNSFGMMSVSFTSILIIPSLNILLSHEENIEIREKKLSIKLLFQDHKDIFEIYLFIFLGIFLVFSMISLVIPKGRLMALFPNQFRAAGILGNSLNWGYFRTILFNNILVLFTCFILSFFYGAGSVIFLTWNSSTWGILFGYLVQDTVANSGKNVFLYFFLMLLPILPHMITEAISYLSASIVGGVISKAVIKEKIFSEKFNHVITDGIIFLVLSLVMILIAAFIEMVYIDFYFFFFYLIFFYLI